MATTDYIFTFTDSTKTNFVVKPYTFNGHQSPANPAFYSNSGLTAVSANTSLVLLGKGMPDYGEAVQNNFVFVTEHFANGTPPLEPIEGQIWYKNTPDNTKGLYVYSGATWDRLIVATATGALATWSMGGFNITNLGGIGIGYTAINQTDLTNAINTHAATGTGLHLSADQNTLLDGLNLPTLTSVEVNYLVGTTSSVQTQISSKLSKTGGAMSGNLSMGSNRIISVSDPTSPDDAATKQYVDSVVGGGGTADGVVNAGSLDPITGVLTLGRTVGVPVVVSGAFAPSSHSHADSVISHNLSSPTNQSYVLGEALARGTYPTPPVYDTLVYLDQAVYNLQRPIKRQLIVSTGSSAITLNQSMTYNVNENRLQVFVNGIKQYANERGHSVIAFYRPIIGLTSNTELAPSTAYSFNITVNGGGPVAIPISTPASSPYTFAQLLLDLDIAIAVTAGLPVSISIHQYLNRLELVMSSIATGTGSAITISFGIGSLFERIVTTSTTPPVDKSITTNYAYNEVGFPGEPSVNILFDATPTIGAVIEVLATP